MLQKNNQHHTRIYEYFFMCLLGIAFLTVYAISTSPLTNNFWGSDSAFFQMVGKNLNHSVVLYKDIFDIKGPYIFLIQYLGYASGLGRYGIFLIEIINLCIVLYFLQKCVHLVANKNEKFCLIASLIFFFFLLACTLDCGNLTEEYALPYLFFCLFLYLRYITEQKIGLAALGYGISFVLASLGRVTNSMFICILVLDIIIRMIVKKEWDELLKSAVLFLFGVLLTITPFFLYFLQKGIVPDMIEAVFTFSFSYAVESSFLDSVRSILGPIMIIFFLETLLALKACIHQYQTVLFLILNVTILFFTMTLGNAYIHYYQLLIPSMLLVFWLWLKNMDSKKCVKPVSIFLTIAILANLVYFVPYSGRVVAAFGLNTKERAETSFGKFCKNVEQLDPYGHDNYGYQAKMYVDDILEKIPKKDRNSVYNYQTKEHWLLLSGLKPYNKYCNTADHFACLSADVADNIETMLQSDPPKYIVTGTDSIIDNPNMKQHLINDYRAVHKNKLYTLYRQKSHS